MTLNQADYSELNRGEGGDKMATSTDGEVKAQNVRLVYGLDAGGLQVASETNRIPVLDQRFVDIDGVIGQNLNNEFLFDNPCGFASIGFRLVVPIGGTVNFEGSFDDTSWTPITLRQIGADGFRNHTHSDENFIGSISNIRKFRARVSQAGSVPGSLHGRVIHDVSTLEGIEHGNPPHQIGHPIFRFGVDIIAPVSGQVLYTPSVEGSHSKSFVITGYQLSMSGTGEISIFDETDSSENWIFAASVKVNVAESEFISHIFSPPFVSALAGNKVKITATGTAIVKGVFTGYEICN